MWRMILSSLLVVWCTSCAGTSAVHDDTFVLRSPVTVKVLGFEGCPNTPELLYRAKLAATSSGRNLDVVYVDQRRLDADDLRRGWPAPTVLVNDADLMGMKQPTSPALGCRLYPNGLPSIEQLSKALRAAVPEQSAD